MFAIAHLDRLHSPIALAWGLLLGWAAQKTGSIRPGLFAHVLNNSIAMNLALLLPHPNTRGGAGVALIVALSLLAGCVLALRTRFTRGGSRSLR